MKMTVPHQKIRVPICSSEVGTMVFAILNFINSAGFSLCGTIAMALVPRMLAEDVQSRVHESSPEVNRELYGLITSIGLIFTVTFMAYISLVFAALLVYGIFKKTPGFIKAYLCYGLFTHIVSAMGVAVVFILESNGNYDIPTSATTTAIALLVVYALILMMINTTYKKFATVKVQYSPQQLKAAEAQNTSIVN